MCITILFLVCLLFPESPSDPWIAQESGTTHRLRGISVVTDQIAWASGAGGTILRTVDGGNTWERKTVPDADLLDFRDIQAFDANRAYALAIGLGASSQIVKTTDGGTSWNRSFINPDHDGFFDALAFWDADHGLVLGDPVGGRFVILTTNDGGSSWSRIDSIGMPEALPGEGAFAASGTCLVVLGPDHAWFGTSRGRVFRSSDRGQTWTVHQTPIRADSPSAGVFSLSFRDTDHGVALGGDFEQPDQPGQSVALTSDGGRSWRLPRGAEPGGYRSAVVVIPGTEHPSLITVGPSGSDHSLDQGETWTPLGNTGFHAVDAAGLNLVWAVGEDGRISRLLGVRPTTP
ncbi:WD40/YVTN/BNR-like repeat-containing protein [Tautonia rosea]|uniref:WD40/YVTN/BNR-like repeat-containing protein n=1 Tax=Tautonia rosea TaxID=2728037 RepID=UPI001475686F|nr:YCF48-related protein [Tautonia rosea]